MLFIFASFFVFQSSVIPISASPIIFGQEYHTGISELYTYDGIETSAYLETDRTGGGLTRVLSIKEVRPNHEVLAGVESVATKGSQVFNYTKATIQLLEEVVKRGPNAGRLARPYMRSPLTVQEIMATGKGVPDASVKGALNFRAPGTFRGSQGTWELVIDPNKNKIYHFNFVSK